MATVSIEKTNIPDVFVLAGNEGEHYWYAYVNPTMDVLFVIIHNGAWTYYYSERAEVVVAMLRKEWEVSKADMKKRTQEEMNRFLVVGFKLPEHVRKPTATKEERKNKNEKHTKVP